jgi:transcription elongation factor Elf1
MKIKAPEFNTFNCPNCEKKDEKGLLQFNDENYNWTCNLCKKIYQNVKSKNVVKPLIRKYYSKKSIIVTERDSLIEDFLNRVGWGNYEQIQKWLDNNSYKVSLNVLRSRLSFLVKFKRLRSTRSVDNTYFALTRNSKRDAELVGELRNDTLKHDNYLIDIFLENKDRFFLTPREIKSQFIMGQKTGPIPDLVILSRESKNDRIHIEYERTSKSRSDVSNSIYNWLWSKRRHDNGGSIVAVLVICEDNEIFNRYCSIAEQYKNAAYDEFFKYENIFWLMSFEGGVRKEMMIFITLKSNFNLDDVNSKFVFMVDCKREVNKRIEEQIQKYESKNK